MDLFFNLVVILPLVVWACMLLFPQRRFTLRVVTSPWPFVALALAWLVACFAQVRLTGLASLELASVQGALATRWGALATVTGWQALTLLAGVWIFRDARFYRIRPEVFLLATLALGPVGPAAYLLARRRRERAAGSQGPSAPREPRLN